MNKLIPAVFFQKQLNRDKQPSIGVEPAVKKPLVLDLYESEMRQNVGGKQPTTLRATTSSTTAKRNTGFSAGVETFSGSAGWLDVQQGDDCGF